MNLSELSKLTSFEALKHMYELLTMSYEWKNAKFNIAIKIAWRFAAADGGAALGLASSTRFGGSRQDIFIFHDFCAEPQRGGSGRILDFFANFSQKCSIIFKFFRNFSFVSFVHFFSWDSLGRCDLFGPKIIKIRAILAIFRSFEDFWFSRRALSITHINYWELPLLRIHKIRHSSEEGSVRMGVGGVLHVVSRTDI